MRRRIALAGQFAAVDHDLTGAENLIVAASLLGYRPCAEEWRRFAACIEESASVARLEGLGAAIECASRARPSAEGEPAGALRLLGPAGVELTGVRIQEQHPLQVGTLRRTLRGLLDSASVLDSARGRTRQHGASHLRAVNGS